MSEIRIWAMNCTGLGAFGWSNEWAAILDKLPADRPRFMAWGWDATMTHELGLAYDESDEIASSQPSEAWKQRAKEIGVAGSGYRPLYGHFYLVDLQ